jgi:hypothetical protein
MATNKENCLKLFRFPSKLAQLVCVLPQWLRVFQKFGGYGVVLESFDGGRVQGCFAAEGRCDDDLALGGEHFVGVCKFWLSGRSQLSGLGERRGGQDEPSTSLWACRYLPFYCGR